MKTFKKGDDVRASQSVRQAVALKFDGFVEVEDAPAEAVSVETELKTAEKPADVAGDGKTLTNVAKPTAPTFPRNSH